jgi:DNA mismatch repair protein MutH
MTLRNAPLWDRTAGDVLLIWVSDEAKYFCKRDWTGQISLNWLGKFGFTRKALGPGFRCTPEAAKNRAFQGAYSSIGLDRCGLMDVRYAPITTKFRIAPK